MGITASTLDALLNTISFDMDSIRDILLDAAAWDPNQHPRAGNGPNGGQFVPKNQGTKGVREVAVEAHKRTKNVPVKFEFKREVLPDGSRKITIRHGYKTIEESRIQFPKVKEVYEAIGGKVRWDPKGAVYVDVIIPPDGKLTNVDLNNLKQLPVLAAKVQNGIPNNPPPNNAGGAKQSPTPKEREDALLSAKIVSHKNIGNGITGSMFVTFSDGKKGIFKPHANEPRVWEDTYTRGYQTEREIAAWEVSKIVGMDDLVTPCVERNYNGKGALLAFQNGEVAENVSWDQRYDGDKDLCRSYIFDMIIGNGDRHSGNWLVDTSDFKNPKLKLIDHGYSFADKRESSDRRDLRHEILHRKTMGNKLPPIQELVKPYKDHLDKIKNTLIQLGLPQGSFNNLSKRVNQFSNFSDWSEIKTVW